MPKQQSVPYVCDVWHLKHPGPGAKKCRAHGLVPSTAHDKGGRWQVRGYVEGRPIPAQSYADARVLLLRRMMRDGQVLFGPLGPDMTIGQLIERFLRDSTLNQRTLGCYGNHLRKHVIGYFGADRKARTIRRKDVIGFRTAMKETSGLAVNTRVNVFAALSALLTAAIDLYEVASLVKTGL